MIDGIPLFQGEAMLLGWADTSTRGKTVTFALGIDEAPEAHPFRGLGTGKHGQRFMIVAVPITDDSKPNSPGALSEPAATNRKDSALPTAAEGPGSAPAPAPGSAPGDTAKERRRFHTLPLAQQAAMMCEREDFIKWCGAQFDATDAAQWVREYCRVTSRAMIKPGTDSGRRWLSLMTQFEQAMGRIPEQRG